MESIEEVSRFLFELSNASRLEILLLIQKSPRKLSDISRTLDFTVQETSRHLTRLVEARLAQKDATSRYETTSLGEQVCSMIPTIEFLSCNKEYFASHSVSSLPQHLQWEIGVLKGSACASHVMEAFKETEELLKAAKQYIWIMSDQVLSSSLPLIDEAMGQGVEFRVILPEEVQDVMHTTATELPHLGKLNQALRKERILKEVKIVLVMSENRALLNFPTVEGTVDYLGFSTTDQQAHEYCRNVFLHFWNSAKE